MVWYIPGILIILVLRYAFDLDYWTPFAPGAAVAWSGHTLTVIQRKRKERLESTEVWRITREQAGQLEEEREESPTPNSQVFGRPTPSIVLMPQEGL